MRAGLSPKTVRNHLVLSGLMFKTARRWRWVIGEPARPRREARGGRRRDGDDRRGHDRRPDRRLPGARGRRRGGRPVLVRGRPQDDGCGALYGPQARRTARAAMAGRRPARPAFERSRNSSSGTSSRTPKSRAGRRTIPLGPVAVSALEEQYRASRYRADESIVFSHPALGTPLDPSKLTRYARKALTKANVPESFRPWHGMRHTALTETAAAGVPGMFVQAKAGHAHGSTTERYLHAAEDQLPGRGRACRSPYLWTDSPGGICMSFDHEGAGKALVSFGDGSAIVKGDGKPRRGGTSPGAAPGGRMRRREGRGHCSGAPLAGTDRRGYCRRIRSENDGRGRRANPSPWTRRAVTERGRNSGRKTGLSTGSETRKAPVSGAFPVAGAGFEPATSGL